MTATEIEDIPEEEEDYSEEGLFETQSWGADLSFRDILLRYEEGELIKPEIQRNYVWDKKEAGRFVESLLLGLPIPSIFLAKKGDSYFIVDGFQRITTVNDFVKGIFSSDGTPFKLLNSESIDKRWRGKSFDQLTTSEKRRILSTTIHTIIFSYNENSKGEDTVLYQVFKRINESGKTLTPQEIRNCVYKGKFNSLLKELNKNNDWRTLYGFEEDSRMKDLELILRFFTLSSNPILNSEKTQISLSKELNKFINSSNDKSDEQLNAFNEDFKNTMSFILNKLGKDAFHNYSKDKEGNLKKEYVLSNKFHPTIFDAIAISTLQFLRSGRILKSDKLENKRLDLLKNGEFIEATSIRTTNLDNIKKRINLASQYLYGVKNEK
ncbi:DUF262 domain-containing protein [Candidatus Pacearchaeota archaeon]|nr:DUF262 domain-containing protein [Candidatus Pacearchaeota archaeon]